MSKGGWLERYTPDLGTVEEAHCGACGALMDVRRGSNGPRGWAEAMGRNARPDREYPPTHDVFTCPHIEEGWHRQVLDLHREQKNTKSSIVRRIINSEIETILMTRQPTLKGLYHADDQDEETTEGTITDSLPRTEGSGGERAGGGGGP